MKRLFYVCAATFGALALTTACSNDAEEEATVENQQFTITATMAAPATRTTVALEQSGSVYPVKWTTGDQIYVWGSLSSHGPFNSTTPLKYGTLPLTGTSNSDQTGTFQGELSGTGTSDDLQYAIYPEAIFNTGYLYCNLPTSYTYSSTGINSKAPMWALFDSSDMTKLSFSHLCAMVRLRIKGYKASTALTVTLTSTNYNFTGYGKLSLSSSSDAISLAAPTATVNSVSVGKEITYTVAASDVNSDNTNYMVFDFPIPTGSMTCTATIVSDKTYNEDLQTASLTMAAGDMKIYDIDLSNFVTITGDSPTGGSN